MDARGGEHKLHVAPLGPPRGPHTRLVLAVPKSRPQTRLMRETAAMVAALDFVAQSRAEGAVQAK